MDENILDSVKVYLGIPSERSEFDIMLLPMINASVSTAWTIGVGTINAYTVSSDSHWSDLYAAWSSNGRSNPDCESILRQYVCSKTKMLFDPPSSSSVLEALERVLDELGWRLNVWSESEEDTDG